MGVSRIPGNIRINIGPRRRKPSPFPPRPATAACPRGFPFYNWIKRLRIVGIYRPGRPLMLPHSPLLIPPPIRTGFHAHSAREKGLYISDPLTNRDLISFQ
jgi:hypothetical protein